MNVSIDALSTTTTPLDMFFDETFCARGTGFYYSFRKDLYLVTCLHNLTGKNCRTGRHLSPTLVEPNSIEFVCYTRADPIQRTRFRCKIREGESVLWKSSIDLSVDIAILRLPNQFHHQISVNMLESKDPPIPRVGKEAFVLGYPRGISVHELPIWKRATIASEWHFNVDVGNAFLLDTASTGGMSGAPVIYYSTSGQTESGKDWMQRASPMLRLLGVYSGREGESENLIAQLGLVWRAIEINKIIEQNFDGFETLELSEKEVVVFAN